jgi:hypothetical protein
VACSTLAIITIIAVIPAITALIARLITLALARGVGIEELIIKKVQEASIIAEEHLGHIAAALVQVDKSAALVQVGKGAALALAVIGAALVQVGKGAALALAVIGDPAGEADAVKAEMTS